MNDILNAHLLEATRLTSAGRLTEATAALQRMLGGAHATPDAPAPTRPTTRRQPPMLDGTAEPYEPAQGEGPPGAPRGNPGRIGLGRLSVPGGMAPAAPQVVVPRGARFVGATFTNEAGSRPYKLYVPTGYRSGRPVPLLVMLHGCTQSPDDFAVGTRMNEAAEEHTCLVAYPGQVASANMQKCWNWFSGKDQRRDHGEPALIAGITRQIMRDHAVDPRFVYVAGLSAGGAAAAIMGDAYPDLFAAIGVHSGLACGAARDMQSAFAAMQGHGAAGATAERSGTRRRVVPAIVFHGDRDGTVSPRNADAVVAQSARDLSLSKRTEQGCVPGGHSYTRTQSVDAAGQTVVEQWVVHGAGHAWFGGSAAGSYTDPRGPDATRRMLSFFLEHPHPG